MGGGGSAADQGDRAKFKHFKTHTLENRWGQGRFPPLDPCLVKLNFLRRLDSLRTYKISFLAHLSNNEFCLCGQFVFGFRQFTFERGSDKRVFFMY